MLPEITPTKEQNISSLLETIQRYDDHNKSNSIKAFIKSERSEGVNSEDFGKIIKSVEFKGDNFKLELIKHFLDSKKSENITSKDVVQIIKDTGIEDDLKKYKIIQDFFESDKSKNITSKDVVGIINETKIADDNIKSAIIQAFFKRDKSENVTSKDVAGIIKNTGIENDSQKSAIIKAFFENDKSTDITPQKFAKMMKEVNLKNRANILIDLCKIKFSSSENYVANFIDITKALHPSEAMQCRFVKEFITRDQINQSNLEHLKPFIEELQDNELASDIIKNLSRKGILENEKDTLSLVKNRSKKQYSFLTETFGDKALQECITQDGINNLKGIFGNDLKFDDGNPITITALIFYYDLNDAISEFATNLKTEFKTELQNKFSPSADKLLYKPQELEKLNQILSQEGQDFDNKSYFVENTKLCEYLKDKVGDVEEVSGKTYQINFTNFVIEEHKKVEINTLFNELLKSVSPDEEKVMKFFLDLLGDLEGLGDNPDNSEKLKVFFQGNKRELVHCFCIENSSKQNINPFLSSLLDGCASNIGAQFKKALYATMIKDEGAQILYTVTDKEIFSAIINNHGQDIMFGNFDPIENWIIKSYSLSPMALVKKLSEETMLTSTKSWNIIGKIAGENKKNEIVKKLLESYPDNIEMFDQRAKEITSFLIIREIVGEEKMTELENKNPKLKELGDFIYDRQPQLSPRESLATNVARESSIFFNCQIS